MCTPAVQQGLPHYIIESCGIVTILSMLPGTSSGSRTAGWCGEWVFTSSRTAGRCGEWVFTSSGTAGRCGEWVFMAVVPVISCFSTVL